VLTFLTLKNSQGVHLNVERLVSKHFTFYMDLLKVLIVSAFDLKLTSLCFLADSSDFSIALSKSQLLLTHWNTIPTCIDSFQSLVTFTLLSYFMDFLCLYQHKPLFLDHTKEIQLFKQDLNLSNCLILLRFLTI
jgi:hypothetical protein